MIDKKYELERKWSQELVRSKQKFLFHPTPEVSFSLTSPTGQTYSATIDTGSSKTRFVGDRVILGTEPIRSIGAKWKSLAARRRKRGRNPTATFWNGISVESSISLRVHDWRLEKS